MFFDDNKRGDRAPQQKPQGLLEIIMSGIIELLLFMSKKIITAFFWIGEKIFGQYFETLKHLLDFRGLQRDVAGRRIAFAVCILLLFPGIPLFYIYKKPEIRDYLTLSDEITLNVSGDSTQIFLPDRSFFVPEQKRRVLDFKQLGVQEPYLSYPIHEEGKMFIVPSGYCQLVTRALSMIVLSKNFPASARGFEKNVSYYVTTTVDKLPWSEYAIEYILNPRYVWKSKNELASTKVTVHRTTSWEVLEKDWGLLETFSSKNKAITVKARTTQHAVICSK
jgi:hypothetical protein